MHKLAYFLLIVSGLAWVAVGVLGWQLEYYLLDKPELYRAMAALFGLAALYEVAYHGKHCRNCTPKM